MNNLENLEPERVFHYFSEIAKIPRCSGDEKKISDYLKKTGQDLGLETIQDELNNIIIRKKASPGYENSPGVIIQGHMDMVCEKEEGIEHDFSTDPIDVLIEDDFLKANGTTLGADNGIAIAMGLAILEDDNLEHPDLELLLTVTEETEMDGALGLKPDLLKGSRLLNIDSEEEGFLTVGSAGGELIQAILDIKREEVATAYQEVNITITGLSGGHSGMEIDKGRANSLKIALKVLTNLKEKLDLKLVNINGGTKDNAIPRKAKISLGIKAEAYSKLKKEIEAIEKELKKNYPQENPKIILEKSAEIVEVLRDQDLEAVIYLLQKLPTGINTWLKDRPETVESSSNLAIINTETDKIRVYVSTRSAKEKVLKEMRNKITADIEKVAKAKITGHYPEWEYKPESELRNKAVEIYNKMYEKEMEVIVIHAGLESGALKKTYPHLDIISFGPDIFDVHVPAEKLSISSTKRTYNYLKKLLQTLK